MLLKKDGFVRILLKNACVGKNTWVRILLVNTHLCLLIIINVSLSQGAS